MSSKKSSKAQAAEQSYKIKDIVLAKVKGYPPWPAMVVDPEVVAKHVKRERPISKKTTFYCVRFFPAGDYSWAVAKDLSLLQTHEIEAYISEPAKKNSELKRGYEIALNPASWEEDFQRRQDEIDAAVAEEEEGVDQLEESEAGEEELASDGEPGAPKKKKKSQAGKKRKRNSANADDLKKKRKSAQENLSAKRRPIAGSKRASKSKASSTENVESEDGGDAMGEGDDVMEPSGKKAAGKKSRASDADERQGKRGKKDREEEEPEDAALASDPEAQRVKEWRHKLQRAFLTGKPPGASDMPALDQIFETVEDYPGLTIDYLQFSKIGKVMRRIASLADVPRDDEFHFKDRASKLVAKWQAVILEAEQQAKGTNGNANDAPAEDVATGVEPEAKGAPVTTNVNGVSNGVAKDTDMVNGEAKETPVAETTLDEKKDEAMDMSDS